MCLVTMRTILELSPCKRGDGIVHIMLHIERLSNQQCEQKIAALLAEIGMSYSELQHVADMRGLDERQRQVLDSVSGLRWMLSFRT